MKRYIIGMGEALWDVLPEGKKIGGAPANFAYHVARQGLNGFVVSAIGNDALGDEIAANFDSKQLNYYLPRVDFPTGTVEVTLDEAGIPQYNIKQGVAWDNIPWTADLEEIARQTQAVCFGSLAQRSAVSRQTIRRFLDAMPEMVVDEATGERRETLKVFDINLRQNFYTKEVLEDSMQASNIMKINDEELIIAARLLDLPTLRADAFEAMETLPPVATGTDCVELEGVQLAAPIVHLCREIIRRYELKMLILTCGTQGSYVFSDDAVSYRPTPRVNVADTVGAGDSFTGAFLSAIIKGRSVCEAHRLAVEVSAYVCTQNGAMPEMPASLSGGEA